MTIVCCLRLAPIPSQGIILSWKLLSLALACLFIGSWEQTTVKLEFYISLADDCRLAWQWQTVEPNANPSDHSIFLLIIYISII